MTNAHVGNVVGYGAITPVLDRWKQGVADGDLSAIASAFTPDALFEGMKPTFTIGRDGVKQYSSAQAPGHNARRRRRGEPEVTVAQPLVAAPH
jgi:uncharacterized protein (TIGR02246 family)